jgi:hypothetical protein
MILRGAAGVASQPDGPEAERFAAKALREWARTRARPVTLDRRKLDAFRK